MSAMLVVVDVESEEREVLGEFVWCREDAVAYLGWEDGLLHYAPEDCVEVKPGRVKFRGPGGLVEVAS